MNFPVSTALAGSHKVWVYRYWEIFLLPFSSWVLVWFSCGQNILFMVLIILNFLRFVSWPYFGYVPWELEKNVYSAVGVVQFVFIFVDFLSTGFINYWERGVEVSSCNCGFFPFFFQFCDILHLCWLVFPHLVLLYISVAWPFIIV